MIFTDRTIIVQKGTGSINDTIILYRGDKGVEIRFTLNEGSPFRFGSGASPNIIEKTEAAYGQLIIKRPNDLPAVFSEIAPTNEGKIVFTITAEMIDEITEVGNYTFQIRLLDESRNSRATLPEVVGGIEIREPIASEDTNKAGVATVGNALTTAATTEDVFDSEGNYNETTWQKGDRITDAKLNKIEQGITGVNNKIANFNNINDTTANAATTYSSNKIETIKEGLSSQIKEKATKQEVDIERKRIDNIISLPDGSTVNDARLEDIKIGLNGEIYDSPGNAVRGQVKLLNEDINKISNFNYENLRVSQKSEIIKGYYYSSSQGKVVESSGSSYFRVDIEPNTVYYHLSSECIIVQEDGTVIETFPGDSSLNHINKITTGENAKIAYLNYFSNPNNTTIDDGYYIGKKYVNSTTYIDAFINSDKIGFNTVATINGNTNIPINITKDTLYAIDTGGIYSFTLSEINSDGAHQTIVKTKDLIKDDGLYICKALDDIAYLRITDSTDNFTVKIYPYDKVGDVDRIDKNTALTDNLVLSNKLTPIKQLSGYRVNCETNTVDKMSSGLVSIYDVTNCDFIRIRTFKFYGQWGYGFLNGQYENILVTNGIPTYKDEEVIIQVPKGAYRLAITWMDENGFKPAVYKYDLNFDKKIDKQPPLINNNYGIFKEMCNDNFYKNFAKSVNSIKATNEIIPTMKKITKSNIKYGHMGQLIIKDGICYSTFIQNSGDDGEATYSTTSEVVLAKFNLSDVTSPNFDADTHVEIIRIGGLGDTFAGHTANSIFKDNSMCLVGNKIYIMFTFIDTTGVANIFRTVYDITSNTLADNVVCDLLYKGNSYAFSDKTLNIVYNDNKLESNASGLIELVSQWSEYNGEYYATGITIDKANYGFIVKTADFKTFTLVDVMPFNKFGCAEIASIIKDGKLYVACRQDYGIPYLIFNSYNLSTGEWGREYKVQDGNVRPWFYDDGTNLYLINTIDEYERQYTNVSKIKTTKYVGKSNPIEVIETIYNCGCYYAIAEYNNNVFYVCTNKGTIYFGEMKIYDYSTNCVDINNKLLNLLDF